MPDGEIRIRYDGQLRDAREAVLALKEAVDRSWWERFKAFFKPHFKVDELPPFQRIRILLLETPEDKQAELINYIVQSISLHFLNQHIDKETFFIMEGVREFQELENQLDDPFVEAQLGGDR